MITCVNISAKKLLPFYEMHLVTKAIAFYDAASNCLTVACNQNKNNYYSNKIG